MMQTRRYWIGVLLGLTLGLISLVGIFLKRLWPRRPWA